MQLEKGTTFNNDVIQHQGTFIKTPGPVCRIRWWIAMSLFLLIRTLVLTRDLIWTSPVVNLLPQTVGWHRITFPDMSQRLQVHSHSHLLPRPQHCASAQSQRFWRTVGCRHRHGCTAEGMGEVILENSAESSGFVPVKWLNRARSALQKPRTSLSRSFKTTMQEKLHGVRWFLFRKFWMHQ